jgi:NAD(P)-dependent dehydrogenase (short-subunit alcohol dehydrogenase family)
VGKALAQILYSHDAKVYVAARSEEKTTKAINEIKSNCPQSKGELVFLHLDLGDLTTIKKSADEFLSKENRLDVLWNNAGVMAPPAGSKSAQGYELQIGTNNIAPFLFTKLLTPLLIKTAKTAPKGSVRVVWVSSIIAELLSPKNGIEMDNLDYKTDKQVLHKYGVSKAGNWYHATEFAKLYRADGITSVVSLITSHKCIRMADDVSRHSIPAISEQIYSAIFRAGK